MFKIKVQIDLSCSKWCYFACFMQRKGINHIDGKILGAETWNWKKNLELEVLQIFCNILNTVQKFSCLVWTCEYLESPLMCTLILSNNCRFAPKLIYKSFPQLFDYKGTKFGVETLEIVRFIEVGYFDLIHVLIIILDTSI